MKKIIIIGGGISGLAAGIYAQKLGFQSVIVEKHTITGGECTGWNRKGFHVDGCIHWLMGTKQGTNLNKIWHEVGALNPSINIHQPDYFSKTEYGHSTVFLYRNLKKLREHLIEVSPEDEEQIDNLCAYIEMFYDFEPPTNRPIDLMRFSELLKFLFSIKKARSVIKKIGRLTVKGYCEQFKNLAIRKALLSIVPNHYSAYILPSTLAVFVSGNGGRPSGGSLAFAKRMEEMFISLGGELHLSKEVKKVIIVNGYANSVLLDDGSKLHGDYIVAACDTHVILNTLLDNRYPDKQLSKRYKNHQTYPLHSSVYISLGIDYNLSKYPMDFSFQTEPLTFEDSLLDIISWKNYSHEPSFSPPNKSVITVYFEANYEWWSSKSGQTYKDEKSRLSHDVIRRIECRFPELVGKIEVLDVATPLTYERYCGAYKGSWMSFGMTPKAKQMMHKGKIKGIKNFYMAGQWLMPPGGLPTALLTGKWAIQRISKNINARFD